MKTTNIEIEKISEIIPLFEGGKRSIKEVAFLTSKSTSTITRWIKMLRDAGYTVETKKKGKERLSL